MTNKLPPVVVNENTFEPVFPVAENPNVARLVELLNEKDRTTVWVVFRYVERYSNNDVILYEPTGIVRENGDELNV
jgi:hypothetical protein